MFDWALIEEPEARFEKMVALELFRAVSNWNDQGVGRLGLHYFRTRESRDVDFLLVEKRRPLPLIEAKLRDATPGPT